MEWRVGDIETQTSRIERYKEIEHVEDKGWKGIIMVKRDERVYLWAIGGTNDHHSG